MIIFISAIIISVMLLALIGISYPKSGWLYVVGVVAVAFTYSVYIPTYEGYAVEDKFIGKEQAIFIGASQTGDWIYLFVQFQNTDQPRLVKIPNTSANQEQVKDLQEKNEGSGISILQFGNTEKAEGASGNGEVYAPGIRALDLPSTELYGNKTR